jgi:hypothetical protein
MTYQEALEEIKLMESMVKAKQDQINSMRQSGVRRGSVSADLAIEGEFLRGYKKRLDYAVYIVAQHEARQDELAGQEVE